MYKLPHLKMSATFVLIILCAILLVENLWLQFSSATLRKQLAASTATSQASPGATVPQLRGHTMAGNTVSYPFPDSEDTLVLVFSKTCGWCNQNWPHWQQLLSAGLKINPVLVDLSRSVGPSYLLAHHVETLPLIHELDPAMLEPYKFRFTPQTILVGPGGKVKAVWTGELTVSDLNDIATRANLDATEHLSKR